MKRKLGSQSSANSESFMSQLDEELQSKLKNIGKIDGNLPSTIGKSQQPLSAATALWPDIIQAIYSEKLIYFNTVPFIWILPKHKYCLQAFATTNKLPYRKAWANSGAESRGGEKWRSVASSFFTNCDGRGKRGGAGGTSGQSLRHHSRATREISSRDFKKTVTNQSLLCKFVKPDSIANAL